ncbi:MAG: bifunctional precorrin-2 dehydrogenase/sirohydrochlorin ferrochelatase [Luteitalea sp.]|nr:bifunctional precorrin-2 dehydrogenase/sirohydrochlorin ferrochelatase [Luteitalea sp.]
MSELLPLFLTLAGRRVLLVGGGAVAASKLQTLLAAGADVRVVSPDVRPEIDRSGVPIDRRGFEPADLEGVWLVVAAAPPHVNRQVAEAAEARRIFVNAVDDPANATAFLSGVVRREGVTLAISTGGHAPGLTGLLREALDEVLPADVGEWMRVAREARIAWRRDGVPMAERRPLLLRALNRIYDLTSAAKRTEHPETFDRRARRDAAGRSGDTQADLPGSMRATVSAVARPGDRG